MKSLRASGLTAVLLLLGWGTLHAQGSLPTSASTFPPADPAPAAGNSLVFGQQPTNTAVDAAISPSVTIQLLDKSGKNLSQAGVSVTLTLSSGTGTLSGTTTRATSSLGVATFDALSINLVGSKQLKASATGFQQATSSAFTIAPGPAAHLSIQTEPSSSATAGIPFATQPVIWVEDKEGNRVTTDNSTVVTASRLAGAGTLQGILTATASNGIITFSNLSHNVANTISILLTSGTLTPDTSRNILVSAAPAGRLAFLQEPTNATAGAVITPSVTVTLYDAFGNPVTMTGTPITVSLASGSGALNGTLTRNTASGTAAFNNLSSNAAGAKSLKATSGTLTAAVSTTFTISPGPARVLAFVQQPTTAAAAAPISPAVTVQIRDSLGNNAPAAGVQLTMALASGSGALGGTTTSVTDNAGLATFSNLNINLAGSKTLSASGPALTTALSTAFTITAGTAANLVFVQQPTDARAGATITPAVTVQLTDGQGNIARVAGISVSFALSSGTGALSGTTSQPTDASGLATFNNLTVNLAGAKRLNATSTGLSPATSAQFTIIAAAASKLEFTTHPGGGIAGIPFATQPVVTLEDAFGNIVTGVAQNVAVAIQHNAGPGGTLAGTKTLALDVSTGRATFGGLSIDRAGNGYTLTATGSTVSTAPGTVVSAPFPVSAGAATHVVVENAADGSGSVLAAQSVTSGTSITIYAISRDGYGNFVANISGDSWTLDNITGSVVSTDLAASIDRKSATFTGRLTGSAAINVVKASLTSVPSGTLTVVVAGAPSQIRVENAPNGTGTVVTDRTIASGNALTVYAVGRDVGGNFVSNLAAESWSLQNTTGGIVAGDLLPSGDRKSATFTGKLLGTTRLRATLGSLATTSSGILTIVAGPPTTITATGGTPQSTRAGSAFPTTFSASVKDAAGNPARAIGVSWSAPTSGASGTFAADGSAATTDSLGMATSGLFIANTVAGSYTVIASIPLSVATAAYYLTNTFGTAARIVTAAGSPQSSPINRQYPAALVAIVTDSSGNTVGGVSVSFAAPATGPSGTFPGGSRTAVVATNPAGAATAPAFTANSGVGSYQVVATTAGVAGGAVFDLKNTAGLAGGVVATAGTPQGTLVGTPFATSLAATVTDSAGNPLSGMMVTFAAPSSGASGRFARGLVDSVVTDGGGLAFATTLNANTIAGSFTILGQVRGISAPAVFQLNNQAGPVDTFLIDAAGGGNIGPQVAGVPFTIRVRAFDEYGNAATSFAGTANISSNGVLSQSGLSTAPFVSGVLTSHTVSIQNAGRFILVAIRAGGAETGRTDTFAVLNPIPTITRVSPTLGRRGQSLSVSVFGSGFLPGVTTVSFGDMISTSTSVVSSTEMAVMVNIDTAAVPGPRAVFAFNGPPGGGTGSLAGAFAVSNNPSPHLTSLSPDSGIVLQRLTLIVTGEGFVSDITQLHMGGGVTINNSAVNSATQLTADISIAGLATAGQQHVFVSNDPPGGGISDTLVFRIVAPPTPYPIVDSPADAALAADTVVTFRWHPWLRSGVVYRLQTSTDQTFATTIVDDSTIADTSRQVASLVPGITYYWRVLARNAVGTSAPSPTRSLRVSLMYPSTLSFSDTVWFPTFSSRAEYQSSDFRLVGLPGNCNVPIRTFVKGSKDVDWVTYWDNGAESDYLVPYDGSTLFNYSPGRAFWVLNKGPLTMATTVPTLPLDSSGSVTIPLHSGWNLITNPFHTAILWTAVQNVNGPGLIPDIWSYNGSFAIASIFRHGTGYMFDNPDNRTAIRIPFWAIPAKPVSAGDSASWRINIALESGNATDRATSIGVSPTASNGRDNLDLRMPRSIGTGPGVYFERPGWDHGGSVFATDIRKNIEAAEIWPLSVRATVRQSALLSLSGVGGLPPQYQIFLLDDQQKRSVDLRISPAYRFTPAIPVSQFRIVVGTEEAAQKVLADLLPKEFVLGQNFPNPFNPSTTFPVSVPRTSTLVLKVYTILGEELRTVFAGTLEAGQYWFAWDGRNASGHAVSSGVYLIRVSAEGGQSLSGKLILLR